ncbi:hypothetical protein VZ95_19900, partial [Elstera litoralis]
IETIIEAFITSTIFILNNVKMPSLLNSRTSRISYTNTYVDGVSIVDDQRTSQRRSMFKGTKHEIEDAQQAEIHNIFTFLNEEKQGDFEKIKIAMKRVYYSKSRRNHSDRLLDLMIAAELLYNSAEESELSLRIRLNAAFHSDEQDKKSVYHAFKKSL